MLVSKKCQYALRAIFELAKRNGSGPVRIADIGQSQAIPVRFLENILNQLKKAGFVASRRGKKGGYLLARAPEDITVGDLIRFLEGPMGPVVCADDDSKGDCPLYGNCAFIGLWERAQKAVTDVYDSTTIAGILADDKKRLAAYAPDFMI
jgi:Rrf2 family protein